MNDHGAATLHVENQVLVTIAVNEGQLSVYPQRAEDVCTYIPQKVGSSPAKPLEVRWAVTGLQKGQKIRIEPKKDHMGVFPGHGGQPYYEIVHPNNTICSDRPQKGPGKPHSKLTWCYTIRLLDAAGNDIVKPLDPDVEIKEDP